VHIHDDHGGPLSRRAGGQSLAEFALVLPILVLLIFGIVDLGRGVYAYNTIANAARQGARVATVNQIQVSPDCDESRPIENPADPHWSIKACAVHAAVSLGVLASDVQVIYSAPPGNAILVCSPPTGSPKLQVGCLANVTVEYTFRAATPIVGNIIGPIAMSSTAEVPIERIFP
jgi:Flp pilus assembly protein TadG